MHIQTHTKETSRRTLSSGKTLTINARMTSNAPEQIWVNAQIDGQDVTTLAGFGVISAEQYRKDTRLKTSGFTHYLHSVTLKSNIPVLPGEVAAFEAARESFRAEVLASDPVAKMSHLKGQRECLQHAIRGIKDQEAYEKERAWERGDEMRAVVDSEQYKADLVIAQQALREFDVAHPEVLAQLRREDDEARQRFLNTD